MLSQQNLWSLSFRAPAGWADQMAECLGEDALSISIMAPPPSTQAEIDLHFNHRPEVAPLTARLAVFCALNALDLPRLHIKTVPKLDWIQKVAADFPPLRIGQWTVHGACHRRAVPNRQRAIQIDVTNAFGTGEHPTTRGCLLMLDRLLKSGRRSHRVADIGCGSAILAIAFARACRDKKAVAVDIDPLTLKFARKNCVVNGVSKQVRLGMSRGYSRAFVRDAGPYDLIMSNILAAPLTAMAKDLRRHIKPGGRAILAGMLTPQAARVLAFHRLQNLHLERRLVLGAWSILVLRRLNRA